MTVAQWLIMLIPAGVFVATAFTLVLLGLLQYRLAARVPPQWRVAAVVLLIGVGALLSVALTTRSLDDSLLYAGRFVLYDDYANGFAASRWLSLLLLGAAVIEVIRGWVRQRYRSGLVSQCSASVSNCRSSSGVSVDQRASSSRNSAS